MAEDGGGETGRGGHSEPSVTSAVEKEKEMPIPRLSLVPDTEHVFDDSYDYPNLAYSSIVLRSLEKHLPPEMLTLDGNEKAKLMSDILRKYITPEDCIKAKRLENYRETVVSNYEPCFRGWDSFDPKLFLLPSFLEAISDNTEASFRRIISEPYPSVFVFQMFQPDFFEKLILEADTFRMWAQDKNYRIKRPSNSNYSFVLENFGLDIMLNKLMQDYIFPLCKVFFDEVREAMFDSHVGYFIEYGDERDAEEGLHMNDSEITLDVCLKKQFGGGDIIFGGTRCMKHIKTKIKAEESFRYSHIPGQAILHRGRHRHSAKSTTTPRYRANMILYCRSSLYREMETYQKDFSDLCGECADETKEKRSQILAAKRKEMIRIEDGAKSSSDKPLLVYVRRP